ncbi:MAG: hypothetical protein M1365_10165 [Actinobacteria bacterium]|nr:hypothetical protein [Actinomycetota bacterium]
MSAIKGIDGKDYYPSTPAPCKIEKKDSAPSGAPDKDSFLKSSPPLSPSIYRLITSQIRKTDSLIAQASAHPAEAAEAKDKAGEPQRYLNIFWNQHQPYYKDEASDSFTQPWVRLHAAKDYYDMAAILENYPNVHVTINLSASLLRQLDEYVDKLHDFADIESPHRGGLKYYPEGHTDRYLDLLLKPVEKWEKDDKEFALNNFFNADYNAQIKPFDGYRYLYEKRNKGIPFTGQDYKDLKVWFNLAWFDHIFQSGDVKLIGDKIDGTPMEPPESVTSIDDLIKKGGAAGYGNANFSEEDAKSIARAPTVNQLDDPS